MFGPTEARILLIVLNSCALLFGPMPFHFGPLLLTPFDVVGVGAAFAMAALLVTRTGRNLRHLARLEPLRRDSHSAPNAIRPEGE